MSMRDFEALAKAVTSHGGEQEINLGSLSNLGSFVDSLIGLGFSVSVICRDKGDSFKLPCRVGARVYAADVMIVHESASDLLERVRAKQPACLLRLDPVMG